MTFTEFLAAFSKAVGGEKMAAVIWAFLASWLIHIAPYVATMVVFVFSDLITGVFAAKKRGEVIHSKGLRKTVGKIVSYFAAISLALIIENLDPVNVRFSYWIAMYILFVEFISNLENLSIITETNIIGFVKTFLLKKIPFKNGKRYPKEARETKDGIRKEHRSESGSDSEASQRD